MGSEISIIVSTILWPGMKSANFSEELGEHFASSISHNSNSFFDSNEFATMVIQLLLFRLVIAQLAKWISQHRQQQKGEKLINCSARFQFFIATIFLHFSRTRNNSPLPPFSVLFVFNFFCAVFFLLFSFRVLAAGKTVKEDFYALNRRI